ncbi:MAG: ribonuclease P protein component [Fibrobacteria bacterium]|nr:ribonuclease P protein component [Fibrobacteria bacterium]
MGRSSRRARDGEIEVRWIQPAPDHSQRMAVRLRRKNGPAPLRNRFRRILRELHREIRVDLGPVWVLWTFTPARLRLPSRELRPRAMNLLQSAGLLPPGGDGRA